MSSSFTSFTRVSYCPLILPVLYPYVSSIPNCHLLSSTPTCTYPIFYSYLSSLLSSNPTSHIMLLLQYLSCLLFLPVLSPVLYYYLSYPVFYSYLS